MGFERINFPVQNTSEVAKLKLTKYIMNEVICYGYTAFLGKLFAPFLHLFTIPRCLPGIIMWQGRSL